jgi:hypothetical protein
MSVEIGFYGRRTAFSTVTLVNKFTINGLRFLIVKGLKLVVKYG